MSQSKAIDSPNRQEMTEEIFNRLFNTASSWIEVERVKGTLPIDAVPAVCDALLGVLSNILASTYAGAMDEEKVKEVAERIGGEVGENVTEGILSAYSMYTERMQTNDNSPTPNVDNT